jgi:CRISPR-associated Csx2 family protein
MEWRMRNVFISFLGLGSYNKDLGIYDYSETKYSLQGKVSTPTKFVQVAELELLGIDFDKIILLVTEKSEEMHFENLKHSLRNKNIDTDIITKIRIGSKENIEFLNTHKKWYESLIKEISYNDNITLDFTHGYRILSLLLSSALYFLQVVKNVQVNKILYGAFELVDREEVKPILQMEEFFKIVNWANAVADFIDHLDSNKLTNLIQSDDSLKLLELSDTDTLEKLNSAIRNTAMIEIPPLANDVLQTLTGTDNDNYISELLKEKIKNKYENIACKSIRVYDKDFFYKQLEVIKILLDHNLLMQAFTIMRELVGSLALVNDHKLTDMNNETGRKRRNYAEVFVNMLTYEKEKWNFTEDRLAIANNLLERYKFIEDKNFSHEIRCFLKRLLKMRNGFDHAWTGQKYDPERIKQSKQYYAELEKIIKSLDEFGYFERLF